MQSQSAQTQSLNKSQPPVLCVISQHTLCPEPNVPAPCCHNMHNTTPQRIVQYPQPNSRNEEHPPPPVLCVGSIHSQPNARCPIVLCGLTICAIHCSQHIVLLFCVCVCDLKTVTTHCPSPNVPVVLSNTQPHYLGEPAHDTPRTLLSPPDP